MHCAPVPLFGGAVPRSVGRYHRRAVEVFNTLGRVRRPLTPVREGRIGIYLCGPTVQSGPHVGHGRSAVAFDVIRRYLEWKGYLVTMVVNITDVEDKIIAAANERGVSAAEVAAAAADEFVAAYRALGVRDPDVMPRATDHIDDMVDHIAGLISRGVAYEAGGDVYFAVRSYPGYGRLSGRILDDMRAGARVDPGEHKRDPLDFALWKGAKEGEPSWESPWGPGRPGWHIECSVMAEKYLGFGFDIHGGGADLIFPHHENEMAQSEALHGSGEFAHVWLHNGLVNLGGEKMSKSTGVLRPLGEVIDEFGAGAVRLFYLRKRYREPLEFTTESLLDACAQLERLSAFRRRSGSTAAAPHEQSILRFTAVMDDDFNTAAALAVLFDVVRRGNRCLDAGEEAGPYVAAYDVIVDVLGLAGGGGVSWNPELARVADAYDVAGEEAADVVAALAERREAARQERDWSAADDIRDGLAAAGVLIEDTPDGPRWYRT